MSTGNILRSIPSKRIKQVVAALDNHFDELSTAPSKANTEQLRASCALLIVHEHGARPGQIARIQIGDVRVLETGAVDYRVVLGGIVTTGFIRCRVKREWCPIPIEYLRRGPMPTRQGVSADSLLGAKPQEVSTMVANLIQRITGESWSAIDLRQAAARLMVETDDQGH